ncbi:molybdopterin-dependent oxidoreductase [Dyella caseinilytica]|uniref:Molybdopterin-dependent oxidoreductase n=1 Tax=Dyella caseinilytica TaxID=1849581 RepID=A0ABX7GV16_9GAMM|nr:molybdopterin-dependent oxidoreductase [Dyella caseinilytica]GFZ91783.1 hypothetical protein GCM10011408_09010 [Dyella caseinilytica]
MTALLTGCLALPVFSVTAQTATPTSPTLRVLVDGKPPVVLDHNTLTAMPLTRADTPAIHHEPATHWQGVSLEDILQHAGAPSGEQLRGHGMTTIVRITATDHYQVVFSLAELDPMLGNEQVMLADTQDGHPIAKDGPYRIVVPGDKRPARWIRNVTTIEVINSTTPSP